MKYIYHIVYIFLLTFVAVSCKKMGDNYKEYIKEGEINYTGKVDSVKVFPGKNRIKFKYLLKSDPKISRVVVYWNQMADSIVQPVQRTSNVDTITTLINSIPQGSYTFTFITYDKDGHFSVKVTASGNVYGDNYETFLNKRPLRSTEYTSNGGALITWFGSDPQMIGTELNYTDKNNLAKKITVPVTQAESVMPDYKAGSNYKYRTLHQPEPNMIDTLYSPLIDGIVDLTDVTATYITNAGAPFQYNTYDGKRFGTLKNWTVTSNVNNIGGFGSFDNVGNSASMAMAKYTDDNVAISQGKISQAPNLPPGTYTFTMYFDYIVSIDSLKDIASPFSLTAGLDSRVVAAAAAAIPNTPTAANALAVSALAERTAIVFSVTKTPSTQVSLGVWANMTANRTWFRSSRVKLTKAN